MSGIVGSRFNIRGSGLVGSLGTDGQVFTSSGAGKSAVFEAAAAGGKVLQVVNAVNQDSLTTTNTSYTATGHEVDITPSATSSKIMLIWNGQIGISHHSFAVNVSFHRDSTDLMGGDGGIYLHRGPTSDLSHDEYWGQGINWLDSPSSTSSITYQVYIKVAGSGTVMFNALGIKCSITAMEIDGS